MTIRKRCAFCRGPILVTRIKCSVKIRALCTCTYDAQAV